MMNDEILTLLEALAYALEEFCLTTSEAGAALAWIVESKKTRDRYDAMMCARRDDLEQEGSLSNDTQN